MKRIKISIWYAIIFLLLINYQVVTIIFNDSILLKYLRDVFLTCQVVLILSNCKIKRRNSIIAIQSAILIIFFLYAYNKTGNATIGFTFIRRYMYPIIIVILALAFSAFNTKDYVNIYHYLLSLLAVLSIWGMFQAYILHDKFLINLGYPVTAGSGLLRSSFYFGNLGIQRVISTVSNTNVFALILGTTIISTLINGKMVIANRKYKCFFIIICIAYTLTFSRANFLAMLIVGVFVLWDYIPKKARKQIVYAGVALIVFWLLGLLLQNGFIVKVTGWIIDTILGNESSSAGRVSIWRDAFRMVMEHPFGLGFGHVGSYAQINDAELFVHAENSYLAIAIDTGLAGLAVYLLMLLSILLIFKKRKNTFGRCGFATVLYMMICFMFSNHIYDLEATALIYLIIGFNMKLSCENKEKLTYDVFSYCM